jgi:hypothetical protein
VRMLVSVEFADAGTKTGTHRVLVVGGCSDATAAGDIGISLEEAKTLLIIGGYRKSRNFDFLRM